MNPIALSSPVAGPDESGPAAVRPAVVAFGPYRLDEANARLTCDGRPVALPPKAFDVLCVLARQPGRLISKADLLDAAWGRRFITEGVLKTVVSELRAALGDDARAPRWIETVSRRGYRFIGRVSDGSGVPPIPSPAGERLPQPTGSPPETGPLGDGAEDAGGGLIGRESELAALAAAWADARSGRRRLVLVSGEPGMGKSSLIDQFVSTLDDALVGAGQCVEQIGTGEPYLPVLDAVAGWCAQEPATVEALRRFAPTWLVQMPWLCGTEERETLHGQLLGANRDRMLREMAALIDELSAVRPLLMVLEDLHWSDLPTVQLLDALARRRGPARLLVVGSFRPTALVLEDHPLADVRREWRLHRLGLELVLEGLDARRVREWLCQRLGGDTTGLDDRWVRALQQHTEGLPLFLNGVIDELCATGELVERGGRWALISTQPRTLPVPASLADVLARQIDRLEPATRALLEAASLGAASFHHLQVADALDLDAGLVQARFDDLVRRQLWLRAAGTERIADGSLGACYVFRHALYRHAFATRVSPAGRVRLHGRIADALESRHGSCCADLVAELAWHAEQALQPDRAAVHLAQASSLALDRFEAAEALALAERGLAALDASDPGLQAPAWPALLALRLRALMTSEGYGAPATLDAARRTQALLERLPLDPRTITLWHAVWWTCSNAGDAVAAARLVDALDRRMASSAAPVAGTPADPSQTGPAPVVRAAGCLMQGIERLRSGRMAPALEMLVEARLAYRSFGGKDRAARFVQDIGIHLIAYLALAAELTGHHALALQCEEELRSRIDAGLDPLAEAIAWWMLAYVAQARGDPVAVRDAGEHAEHLYGSRGVLPGAPHRMTLGWAAAALGDAAGAALAQQGLAQYVAEGSRLSLTWLRVATVEALCRAGRLDDARSLLEVAQRHAVDDPSQLMRPELDRVAAGLHRACGRHEEAHRHLQAAVARAREQGAVLLELAALLDLADDPMAGGPSAQAARMLAEVLERLPDGAGGPRVRAAMTRLGRTSGEAAQPRAAAPPARPSPVPALPSGLAGASCSDCS